MRNRIGQMVQQKNKEQKLAGKGGKRERKIHDIELPITGQRQHGGGRSGAPG